jgi:hypothetical protein
MLDVQQEGQETTPSSSSEGKQTPSGSNLNASEGGKTQEKKSGDTKGKTIPFERFQKVYRDNVELKDQMERLKEEFETLKGQAKQEEGGEFNPKAWDEVFAEVEKRVMTKFEATQKAKDKVSSEGEKILQREMDLLQDAGEEFDADRENAFMQFIADNEIGSIPKAYELFKVAERIKAEKEQEGEKTVHRKSRSATGSSAKASDGGGENKSSYERLHKSSLDDLVYEEMEKMGLIK